MKKHYKSLNKGSYREFVITYRLEIEEYILQLWDVEEGSMKKSMVYIYSKLNKS